jgi:hypothetical protein
MSGNDQERMEGLVSTIHVCSDNGQSQAADNARSELRQIIEGNINDSRTPENVSCNDNSK